MSPLRFLYDHRRRHSAILAGLLKIRANRSRTEPSSSKQIVLCCFRFCNRTDPSTAGNTLQRTLGKAQTVALDSAQENTVDEPASGSQTHSSKKGMILPFQPLSMTFHNVNYYVDMPMAMKQKGVPEKKLQLLSNVSGVFSPGVLTALVGASGAGKTTLMDVLAGRKTGGYIEGNIRISGYPKEQSTFARISGYVEQNDIHSPQVTVEESLKLKEFLPFLMAIIQQPGCLKSVHKHVKKKLVKTLRPYRNTTKDLFAVMGALYCAAVFLGMNSSSSIQPVISIERTVFYREKAAGMYSPFPYAAAQVRGKFFLYLVFMFLTFAYFTFYGMMAVGLTPSQHVAAVVSSAFYSLWELLSGFLVPKPNIPGWWIWFYYISPVAWTLRGIISSQLGDVETQIVGPEYLEVSLGYGPGMIGVYAAVLVGFSLLFFSVYAASIKVLNFQKR
ncbi:hypothetical protein MRB53_032984 [Persea americana]|uniref:Uncharacterized protein n=1 Tax=Persea americana TaxID=3435 RepID=A0ACC2KTE6_PERAE|nr:hypothetical protein MRB53_032984 [Persea americana]